MTERMDRALAILPFWDWVPAFRIVAESSHLPTAGEVMGLSPSALSRAIRALEDALGQPLFDRVGRELRLNNAGETFLVAARDAMRLVHEGMLAVRNPDRQGEVRLLAPSHLWRPMVMPAISGLRAAHPKVLPHARTLAGDAETSLRRGRADVIITFQRPEAPDLKLVALTRLEVGLFTAGCETPQGLVTIEGDTPIGDALEAAPKLPVYYAVANLEAAVDIAAREPLALRLPVVTGAAHNLTLRHRGSSVAVHMATRTPLSMPTHADLLASALEKQARRLGLAKSPP